MHFIRLSSMFISKTPGGGAGAAGSEKKNRNAEKEKKPAKRSLRPEMRGIKRESLSRRELSLFLPRVFSTASVIRARSETLVRLACVCAFSSRLHRPRGKTPERSSDNPPKVVAAQPPVSRGPFSERGVARRAGREIFSMRIARCNAGPGVARGLHGAKRNGRGVCTARCTACNRARRRWSADTSKSASQAGWGLRQGEAPREPVRATTATTTTTTGELHRE